ncbi:polyprenyl synthetase family protein, partial [Vibrio parahaemolyticus]|uniref:polyprenyl synthetase family protein n=1 Tax=Vibrio parahaemolyticus TaxID=670 RepID=UPI0021159359
IADGPLSPRAENQRVNMIKALAHSSGANVMCVGQALDLGAENRQVSLAEMEEIHSKKTGALIDCAVKLGALAAGEKGIE